MLIIAKEHKGDYFDLSPNEKRDLEAMLLKARELVQGEGAPDGYNIGMNCGEAAEQTVMHFHCHLIPRRNEDIDDPRGGVRGVIPDKRIY